jgi:hypothetical protein
MKPGKHILLISKYEIKEQAMHGLSLHAPVSQSSNLPAK